MSDVLEQTKAVSTCGQCLSSVKTILTDYIPTFRFGVLSNCHAVSISINPAENQEGYRPLPRCGEYASGDRSALTDDDLADLSRRSDEYFEGGRKHRFFNTLASVVSSIDQAWNYESGNLSHIDVVSCVTRPKWTGVPVEERQVMLKVCRQHFLKTLSLLPSGCWLLCDGQTVVSAVEEAGGTTEKTVTSTENVIVCRGTLKLDGRTHKYLGWNRPAHKLYGSPTAVGTAARELMDGCPNVPEAGNETRLTPESSSEALRLENGRVFTGQRDLMRALVGELGRNKDAVCQEYANAERQCRIPRTSNKYGLTPEQYARRLYADGIRKGWL